MKLTKATCIILLSQIILNVALAQQNLIYNQYYLNPFLYNPSYIAPNGYTELFLNYRLQWAGFDGAPTTGTANFHHPLNYKMGIGASFIHDQAGLLKTTTGMLSFGYQIYFGNDFSYPHKLAFGLSAGITNSNVSSQQATNPNDPALANNKTSSIDGQFGLHYQNKNLRIGFALPRIFKSYVVSEEGFNKPGVGPITSTISSLSYNFIINPRISVEPIVLYRTEKDVESQFEGMGVIKFDNLIWGGGSYRQNFGATAFVGLNMKDRLKISYGYEFTTGALSRIGNGSHEIQLAIRLGNKKSPPVAKEKKPVEEKQEPVIAEEPQEKPVVPVDTPPAEVEVAEKIQQPPTEIKEPQPVIEPKTVQPENIQKEEKQNVVIEEATVEQQKPKTLSGESLAPGHYVVVGAFRSMSNAKNYKFALKQAGYPADVAFYPLKGYYLVHMKNASTLEEARVLRGEYRAKSRYSFRDTWILSVE